MVKTPIGWRRQPARHSLASKGIETKILKTRSSRSLALPQKALRTGTPGITEDVKARAVDQVLTVAWEEGKGEPGAVELLDDDHWLKVEAEKVANAICSDAQERGILKEEIVRTLRADQGGSKP